MDAEEWRFIPGYDTYIVSTHGNVKSLPRVVKGKLGSSRKLAGKTLTPYWRRDATVVNLWKDNRYKQRTVHQLVLETFIGPRPPGAVASHKDGDVHNNEVSNLEWRKVESPDFARSS